MKRAVFLALLTVCSVCWADDFAVDAELSQPQIALGEVVQFTVTVHGTQDVPPPAVDVPGLTIQYLGPATMLSIVNGQMSSSITHRFLLFPQKEGNFTLGPFPVHIGSSTLETQSLTLEVLPRSSRPSAPPPITPPAVDAKQVNLDNDLRLKIGMDKARIFVNELAFARIQLVVGGIAVRGIEKPTIGANEFQIKSLGPPKRSDVPLGQQRLSLLEFDMSVSAPKPGKFLLGPAQIGCEVVVPPSASNGRRSPVGAGASDPSDESAWTNLFGSGRVVAVTVTSDAVPIEVLPLPEEGKPQGFAGAVGDFTIEAAVLPRQAAVGRPVTLTLIVRGTGNFDTVTSPVLHSRREDFKTSEPSIRATVQADREAKVFEQVIVPLSAGIQELPEITFSFFDPESKTYRTVAAEPISFHVQTGEAESAAPPEAAPVPQEPPPPAAEILPPAASPVVAAPKPAALWLSLPPALWAGIVLAIGVALLLGAPRKQGAGTAGASDSSRAHARAVEECRRAEKLAKERRVLDAYQTLLSALQRYVSERFGLSAESLTQKEIESVLSARNIPQDLIAELTGIWERCEAARLKPVSHASDTLKDTITAIEAWLKHMEAVRFE